MNNLKILSLALAASCSFYACSDDDDGSEQTPEVDLTATAFSADSHVNISALPQSALDYISTNYPEQTIYEAEVEDNDNYEVELSSGVELIFDSEGNFLGVDEDGEDSFGDEDIEVSSLPQEIVDFLENYYPGISAEEAEIENNGHIRVELDNDTTIIFDADGNFLGQAEDENGNEDEGDEDIEVAELPQAITDYISENYPDLSIIEAEMEDEGFEVSLNDGTEIKFDSDGNFVSAEDQNGDDDSGEEGEEEDD